MTTFENCEKVENGGTMETIFKNKKMFLVKKKHTLICGGNAELINISTQCRKIAAKVQIL